MLRYTTILALFFTSVLASCTKEIDIDLRDAEPLYVVQAELTQEAGSARVEISRSLSFSADNEFPTVSGALVTIAHAGRVDTLTETAAGVYTHPSLAATVGERYDIRILPDPMGQADLVFTSSAVLPPPVPFDSIRQENLTTDATGGRPQRPDEDGNVFVVVTPVYTDPADEVNFYKFELFKNEERQDGIVVFDDKINNGNTNNRPVFLLTKAGDTLTVEMENLDEAAFKYFYGLEETLSQSSAAPANPPSNLSAPALGYFKVHYSQRLSIVIR